MGAAIVSMIAGTTIAGALLYFAGLGLTTLAHGQP